MGATAGGLTPKSGGGFMENISRSTLLKVSPMM
jgi:hypothetical protein